MAEKDEALKPVSFRIDEETKEKFKLISNEIGGNQQIALNKLIEAWQFQKGKEILADKKSDIEKFEEYITLITGKYMDSLKENKNITETVRGQFQTDIDLYKDKIGVLQNEATSNEQLKVEATEKAKRFADENISLQSQIDKLQKELDAARSDFESKLSDKENLNRILTDTYNTLKAESDSMKFEYDILVDKSRKLDKVTIERDNLDKEVASLKKQLDKQIQEHDKALEQADDVKAEALENQKQRFEVEKEKSILELERKYQEQIAQIKEEKAKEVDLYQKKYFELIERSKAE